MQNPQFLYLETALSFQFKSADTHVLCLFNYLTTYNNYFSAFSKNKIEGRKSKAHLGTLAAKSLCGEGLEPKIRIDG